MHRIDRLRDILEKIRDGEIGEDIILDDILRLMVSPGDINQYDSSGHRIVSKSGGSLSFYDSFGRRIVRVNRYDRSIIITIYDSLGRHRTSRNINL